jgi:hypothetical protein
VRRNIVVIRDAKPCDGADACGAAATARSAHSAVATITTAITCFVRRIGCFKIGQSIEVTTGRVKESRPRASSATEVTKA